ncbi:polysaccharide deacetylase family protein [Haloterrigena salifodinae]|uniref:Polysaccharide deacetylase family protein n=1 Tax=Haloterrigena salifodinae TaxID=2675099 RepID=A0A8T8DW05_9EURY|nr:polysaccharide deacetylase family protein [Haloterrigena salifodinae]QRV13411.1 polysaccharide deacetylase family protein [Haloterrigena salifodinae]
MTGFGRRDVCRVGAAGALAVAGLGTTGTGAVVGSAEQNTNGRVVFVYDDSWREDWTDTFPVHQDEGVPACSAAVVDHVDTSWGLLPEHLREMEDAGWEIMAHTTSHVAVGNLYLTAPAAAGDERLYLDGSFLAEYEGEEIVISDGDRTVENAVAGGDRDDTGIYLDLAEPVGESFDAGTAYVRFTEDRIRDEVVSSKEALEELGVEVDGFVSPYGRSDGLVEDLVRDHYAAFANRGGNGVNALEGLDPHALGRSSIDGHAVTEAEIEAFFDDVAANDALGIAVGHSQFDETTPERIRFAIRAAKERDLEIVTLRTALADLGFRAGNGGGTDGTGEESNESNGTDGTGEESDESDDDSLPGFGIAGTLAGLGTAGYLLSNRRRDDERS